MTQFVVDASGLRSQNDAMKESEAAVASSAKSYLDSYAPGLQNALPTAGLYNAVAEASRQLTSNLQLTFNQLHTVLIGTCNQVDGAIDYYEKTDEDNARAYDQTLGENR